MPNKIQFDKKVVNLGVAIASGKPTTNFSLEDMTKSFNEEVRKIIPKGDWYAYGENKYALFRLITEISEKILPKKINDVLGRFSNVRQFAQGEKARFERKASRTRAKQYITKVAVSGIYETFRLDVEYFDMSMEAVGGAYQFHLEEFLDGRVDPAELLNIVMEGIEEQVYIEVYKALRKSVAMMPARNQYISNQFEQDKMAALINTVNAYGTRVEIFCSNAFAQTIFPYSPSGVTPDAMIGDTERAEYRARGYTSMFAGAAVNVMPQTFTDEKNQDYVVDPAVAFILPTGGPSERVVNVGFEGQLIVDDFKNRDRSTEVQMYKKFGVTIINVNHIGIYENVSLRAFNWDNGYAKLVASTPSIANLKTWINTNKVVDGTVLPVPMFDALKS